MALSLAEIRLEVVSLAHRPGEAVENVLNRADSYLEWVFRDGDKGDSPPTSGDDAGAPSGDKLGSAPGVAPGQASSRSNRNNRNRR